MKNKNNRKTGVIYTCITGGYDTLVNHAYIDQDWDYVCFSDNLSIGNDDNSSWQIKPLIFDKFDNSRNQRWHKIHPHILFPEYEKSIWLDASTNILNKDIFNDIDKAMDESRLISIAPHPERNCIYEELIACVEQGKDDERIMRKQVSLIRSAGFPEKKGLFETNIMYREHHNYQVIQIMNDWWWWIENYSRRDQLSLTYVLWQHKFEVKPLTDISYRYSKGMEFINNTSHVTKEELIVQRAQLQQEINLCAGRITCLNQVVTERDRQIAGFNQTLAERDGQIINLAQMIQKLTEQVAQIDAAVAVRDKHILALYQSTSWRIMKPLREVSMWRQRFIRLLRIFQNYRQTYPGFSGFQRLSYHCIDAIRNGGIKGLRNKVSLYERIIHKVPELEDDIARQYSAQRIDLLQTHLEKGLILNPTILFDHNGGGGANIYTRELVKNINSVGDHVLRVYCFDAVWFVQWTGSGDKMLFYAPSIEELFNVLSVSRSASIIINSLYGYPDIKAAASNIVGLCRELGATLDFKIHDFYALCPSPHLSDFEEKYCNVPQDVGVCKFCLQKNINWYHSWYREENRPIDIAVWRRPFSEIFEASTTVTFFDQSSVEIVHKAFCLDVSKIKIIPHVINYFKCDNHVDITGPLHIGILGVLSHIKGGNVVKALYEHIDKQRLEIPITVVGPSLVDTPQGINIHGNYMPNDLPVIISKQGINVILMPSIVPETFSYTISEAMIMGLPIVAFDIGAQGHRVKQYTLGKVIPLGSSPKVVLAEIQSALKAAQELKK